MIDLSTKPEQIIKELSEEQPKATYWLKKHYRSERAYNDEMARLHSKAYHTGEPQHGEIIHYHSKCGNRWVVYLRSTPYGEGVVKDEVMGFVFYETYGSLGAFVPTLIGTELSNEKAALIFTSHFFLRYNDRNDTKCMNAEMIIDFFVRNPKMTTQLKKCEDGSINIDLMLNEGLGRGKVYHNSPNVFEIRTFLKTLTNKQKKDTERLKAFHSIISEEPMEVMIRRAMKCENPSKALYALNIEAAMKNGLSYSQSVKATEFLYYFQTLIETLYKSREDWLLNSYKATSYFNTAIDEYEDYFIKEKEDAERPDWAYVYKLTQQYAQDNKLKFDKEKVLKVINDINDAASKADDEQS